MKARVIFVSVFFLLALTATTFAQESRGQRVDGWVFNIEPVFGARLGQCKEIVWNKKSGGDRYKLSELVYDILPAWYVGANVGMQYKRFELSLLSKFYLSSKSGHMEDSDWQNTSDTSMKTDLSRHNLFISSESGLPGYDLELAAAFNFYPTSFLTLAPTLSFDAQYMSFKAKDGTGWYGWHNPSPKLYPYDDQNHRTVTNFDGKSVMDYEVYNLFVWSGIRADFIPASWAKISLASELALFWAMIDKDHHRTTGRYYVDITYSAFYAFRQSVKAEFKIKKFFSICQKTCFTFTGESKGEMYIKQEGESKYKKAASNSGSQLFCVDLELSAKFSW